VPTESAEPNELVQSVNEAAQLSATAIGSFARLGDADLFAALGYRLKQSSADRFAGKLSTPIDIDDLPRDTALLQLGQNLFHRWNGALHEFVCKDDNEDEALRQRLLGALTGKQGGATALLPDSW
jgi:hypothetical protein